MHPPSQWHIFLLLLLTTPNYAAITNQLPATATQSFAPGLHPSFHNQDFNDDAVPDDQQDMSFRFTFTTPAVFEDPGFLIFETGRTNLGTSFVLNADRLVLYAGGKNHSSNGRLVINAVSHPLQTSTQYEVVFGLLLDHNQDGTNSDTRAAIYTNGVDALDRSFPGSQVFTDIRINGQADWSGTGPAGYGAINSGALSTSEDLGPRDFSGVGYTNSTGSLDSPLTFFADTFLERTTPYSGPNILLITADDLNADTVGVFGGPHPSVTPKIDQLAAEGIRFERAHVSIGVCQPCRQSLLTGLYPHTNGGEGFEPIDPLVMTLCEILDNHNYRLGILSKNNHLAPGSEFQWDTELGEGQLAQGRNPEIFYTEAKAFFDEAIAAGRPFFLMANSNDPHRPFHGSLQESNKWSQAVRNTFALPSKIYAPGEIATPGFLPDLPDIQNEMAQYFSSARRCDDSVGRILDALEAAGAKDNTIVIFLSDNGIAVPFAKTNCWHHSTRTPLIIRWPEIITAGMVDPHHFVSGVDLTPTLLDALGLHTDIPFDGRSFFPLLQGHRQSGRDAAFTAFHETSSNRRYEMRAMNRARYGYIFNAWADGSTVFQNESQNGLSWNAMSAAATSDAEIQARVDHFELRRPEELYDYTQDRDAIHSLESRPELLAWLDESRREMHDWMVRTADPLLPTFLAYVAANPLNYTPLPDPPLSVASAAATTTLQIPTQTNMIYRVYSTTDLQQWQLFGTEHPGTGTPLEFDIPLDSTKRYFQLDRYLDFDSIP